MSFVRWQTYCNPHEIVNSASRSQTAPMSGARPHRTQLQPQKKQRQLHHDQQHRRTMTHPQQCFEPCKGRTACPSCC
jgi:hypothetical protein